MFSQAEKRMIAQKFEDIILGLKHPEMPSTRPNFVIKVVGKEDWSWANIEPNWKFDDVNPGVNPWNEKARSILTEKLTDQK